MIPKRLFLFSLFSLLFSLSAFSQTAAEIDTLLSQETVSVTSAARYVLGAAGTLPPELSGAAAEAEAYTTARSNGWLTSTANESITMKELSYLIMKAFDLKGGVMYKLLRNPRYAYREMIYRKVIQGRADPAMNVSGQRLLQIIGRTLSYAGEL